MNVDPTLQWLLGGSLVLYLVVMYAIAWWAQSQIETSEDFLVAGRRLPLSLSWMTLLATWFGAGTILAAADEVSQEGLRAAALDPLGAGFCLLFVALFVAGPLWRMQLLTVPDFFRQRFGPRTELLSCLILVPSYFGWVAAQFMALAGMLNLFFGLPFSIGLALVAVIGTGYTLMGGMWSVTLTDAVQIVLVLAGLLVLTGVLLWELGAGSLWGGWTRLQTETPAEMLIIIPWQDRLALLSWLGVFATGALGNVPGQDLLQRVFAAKSDRVAQYACGIAGVVYLLFGCLPLVLALAGNLMFPEEMQTAVLPALAQAFLSPWIAVIFLLALMSAILSTIDSAILSPASVLAQNVFTRFGESDPMKRNRLAVLLVAACSLAVAYLGESAYDLLEEAYLLTLVGLFVPLMLAIYFQPRSSWSGMASMLVGGGVWAIHFFAGWNLFLQPLPTMATLGLPISLAATGGAFVAYLLCEFCCRNAPDHARQIPGAGK